MSDNTYTPEELTKILEDHRLYLHGDPAGKRADLNGANLSGANLGGANLSGANLRGADLSGANLRDANLSGAYLACADLRNANLKGAYLACADLRDADLYGADLNGANLSGANLYGANLEGIKIENYNLKEFVDCNSIVPSSNNFTAFKAVYDKETREKVIIKLEIQSDSKRIGGIIGRKCRANKVKVVSIPEDKLDRVLCSGQDMNFVYELGKTYIIDNFDDNPLVECVPGIHFFLNEKEAENFTHRCW